MKTIEEIKSRMKEVKEQDDFFGAQMGEFIEFLPFVDAKEFLKDDVKEADWKYVEPTRENIIAAMQDYLEFAVGKSIDHRGISAGRSLDHYRALTWLLGDYEKINWDNYSNYGCPVLKQIAELYELKCADLDNDSFKNMAVGDVCGSDCDGGCA